MRGFPKKIAILLPSLKFGGAERISLNLANEMKSLGIAVDILVMSKEGEFLAEAEANFSVFDLRCNRTYKLPYRLLSYTLFNRPEVVISSFLKLNLCASLARIIFPVHKLILWEHAPPSMASKFSVFIYSVSATFFYQFSSKVVAVSNGVKNDIASCTIGLKRKLKTIYNPITPPNNLVLMNAELSIEKNINPLIISLGRLEPEKNHALLLQAFSLLRDDLKAKLLIVGDGSLRRELEQICIKLRIEEKVIFFGFASDPYKLLIKADLLVLSSNFEGFGNVIVEAMYCGLPIVSTDCPCGPGELLMDGAYGSLVPVNDGAAMARAIEYELLKKRPSEVQINAAQRFLPSVIAKQFLELMN
jgi:glycosyltransferase involved in cell wall biosynthesis